MNYFKPIKFCLVSLGVLTGTSVLAQNAYEFGFIPSSKPFNYVTNGKSVSTPTNATFGGDENRTYNPLGFTFNFCGTDYTYACASSNGWLSLVFPPYVQLADPTTDPPNEYNDNTINTGGPGEPDRHNLMPVMMPFWDNLTGAATGTSTYKTTGIGRNHIFVFEWKNWGFIDPTGSPVNNSLSMQVKIYEYGAIEFLYKQEANTPPITADGATIGFAEGDDSAHYQTLNNSSATPVSSYKSFITTIFARPATDQSYIWFPKHDVNNVGVIQADSPSYPFCTGPQNIYARVMNFGKNRVTSMRINWEVDGVAQPPVNWTGLLDTFGSTNGNEISILLDTAIFASAGRTITIYTTLPNNTNDPVKRNDTLVQVIKPAPTIEVFITGPTIYCTGQTVNTTLDATSSPFNNYQWYKNGAPLPGAVGAQLGVSQPGVYYVKVDSNGCTINSNPAEIQYISIPFPIVTPSGNVTICDTAVLTANPGNLTNPSFQWQRQGLDIPGATMQTYKAITKGNYTVRISKFICSATSAGVNLVPATKPEPKLEMQGNTLVCTPNTFTAYQWVNTDPPAADVTGATNASFKPNVTGNYAVRAYNGDCSGMSDTMFVDVPTESVNYVNGQRINIYPNPATSTLYVDAPAGTNVIIDNIEGKNMMAQQLTTNSVNISNLPAGVYIIKVLNKEGTLITRDKFVKSN